jgi:23S rRNA (uracil1939-C5)-methyltransferase
VTEPAHGAGPLGRTPQGQVVFVDDALPGERVIAQPLSRRRNYQLARATAVLTAAPGRVEPPCPYVPVCGGCQWQHASYQAQLEMKVDVFAAMMRRAGVGAPVPDVVPCDEPFRYRLRGEFHVVGEAPPYGLGFNRRRSWTAIAVEDCLIHHPNITEALPGIREALDAAGAGSMRSIHLTTHPVRRELLWQARGGAAPGGLQRELSSALPGYLVHQDSLTLEYDGGRIDGRPGPPLAFRVDSDTFIQVNHAQAHLLYGQALRYLGDRPGRLLEGYAGFGAMSVLAATREDVAARPRSALLVEEARASSILGRLHLRMHEVEGEYLHGRLEDRLATVPEGSVDSVLIDPPRAGCAPEVVAELARVAPSRVVYVSCDPATLARDLSRFTAAGYEVGAQAVVDMFPQTYHVESVTLLQRSATIAQ